MYLKDINNKSSIYYIYILEKQLENLLYHILIK